MIIIMNIIMVSVFLLTIGFLVFAIKTGKINLGETGNKPKISKSVEYGSARMMTEKEKNKKYKSYIQKEDSIEAKTEHPGGVIVESKKVGNGVKVTYEPGKIHHIIFGSTGAGKTTGWIWPSLISIMNARGTMIISDPKGELYIQLHNELKEKGYNVQVLNFTNPSAGQTFNQMDYVNYQYRLGLPYLYRMKGLQEMIKFIDYTTGKISNNEIAKNFYYYSDRMESEGTSSRGTSQVNSQFHQQRGKVEQRSISQLPSRRPIKDGEKMVAHLINFLENVELPSDNEFLKDKKGKVINETLEVLKKSTPEDIKEYFSKLIVEKEEFMATQIKGTMLYNDAKKEKEEYEEIINNTHSPLSLDILRRYFEVMVFECEKAYSKCENEAVTSAQTIASMIVESSEGGGAKGEAIWSNGSKALITSLALLVAREGVDEAEKHLGSVYSILANLTGQNEKGSRDESSKLDVMLDCLLPNDAIKLSQAAMTAAGSKTKASFYTSAISAVQLWSDQRVVSQCQNTSFDIESIVGTPTAVFLNVPGPDTQPTYTILASLFIEQCYSRLVGLANQSEGLTLERPVYFMLDEFGNLPRIPNFDSKISLARSRNIKLNIVIQSLGQLDKLYKEERNTILGNSNIIYILTNEIDTAKYISERLGKYTAEVQSTSTSSKSFSLEAPNQSVSTQKFGRELYTPTELMDSMPDKKAIYIATKQYPMEVDLYPSYLYPNFKRIEEKQEDDLHTERPYKPIKFFNPENVNNFAQAYQSLWRDCIFDKDYCGFLKIMEDAESDNDTRILDNYETSKMNTNKSSEDTLKISSNNDDEECLDVVLKF